MTTPLDNGRVSVREAVQAALDYLTTQRPSDDLDAKHIAGLLRAALSTPPPDDGRARQLAFDIWDVWLNSSSIHPSTAAFAQKAAPIIAAALEEEREWCAQIADRWNSPVSDSEFVNAQSITAQQIAAYIRDGRALKGRESK